MTPGATPTQPASAVHDLAGRVAVVTGASRGIGAAVTRRFLDAGVHVAALARDPRSLEQLAADTEGSHGRLLCRSGDVREASVLHDLVAKAVDQLGGVDIVVSNAGGVPPAEDGAPASTRLTETVRLNTGPTLDLVDAARAPLEASSCGSIVVIGSVASRSAQVTNPAYAASKAALDHLVRIYARQLAPQVRINAVLPGPIVTDAFEAWAASRGESLDDHAAEIPLRRMGRTDDVAEAVEFFASDRSSWVTGQLLEVDGGATSTL